MGEKLSLNIIVTALHGNGSDKAGALAILMLRILDSFSNYVCISIKFVETALIVGKKYITHTSTGSTPVPQLVYMLW